MGLYYQPPQPPVLPPSIVPEDYPFVLNNPPFGQVRSCEQVETAVNWIPPDPFPTQKMLSVIPAKYPVVVSNPPVVGNLAEDYLEQIIVGWIPPDPQPTQKFLSVVPAKYPVILSNPPIVGNLDQDYLEEILINWIPPDPQPVQKGNSQPQLLFGYWGANPPFGQKRSGEPVDIYDMWIPPDPQPVQKGNSNPQLLFGKWGSQTFAMPVVPAAMASWLLPDPLLTSLPKVAPLIPVILIQPAFIGFLTLENILDSWIPPDPLPTQNGNPTPQLLFGVWGSQPPTINKGLVEGIVNALPPDPMPVKRILTMLPGWSVDNPPPRQRSMIEISMAAPPDFPPMSDIITFKVAGITVKVKIIPWHLFFRKVT